MSMGEYIAAKDAERADGSVDWDLVPIRFGGNLDSGHPEDGTADEPGVMSAYYAAKDAE